MEKGIKVDAVSWNAEELVSARRFCRRVIQCDLNNGIEGIEAESYDGVICSHILEHIAYPQQLLRDIERSLVPGGFLLVVIPNLLFWSDRMSLFLGRWEYQSSGTFDYTHVRWYTAQSMHRLLSAHGFIPDRFIAEGWIPLPGLRFMIGRELRRRLNALACRVSPGLFGKQLIFRARKSRSREHGGWSREWKTANLASLAIVP
jgi:SAM-dependent methyltransferase